MSKRRFLLKACTISFIAAIAVSVRSQPKLGAETFTTTTAGDGDDDEEEEGSNDKKRKKKKKLSASSSYNTDDPHMELLKVQSIFRHGARTPIGEIPRTNHQHHHHHAGSERIEWNNCAPFQSMLHSSSLSPSSYQFQSSVVPNEQHLLGTCMRGQLTNEGVRQMEQVGHSFARRYAHWILQSKHLSTSSTIAKCPINGSGDDNGSGDNKGNNSNNDSEHVTVINDMNDIMYVRSTDVTPRRTEQSAQGFLTGFLNELFHHQSDSSGSDSSSSGSSESSSDDDGKSGTTVRTVVVPPMIYRYEYTLETMYPNTKICPRIGQLLRQLKHSDPVLREMDQRPDVIQLNHDLRSIFQLPPNASISVSHTDPSGSGSGSGGSGASSDHQRNVPTFEALHNGLQMYVFHGKPLPHGMNEEHVSSISRVVSDAARRIFSLDHEQGRELTSLSVGLFLHELVNHMDHCVNGTTAVTRHGDDHHISLSPSHHLKNKPIELYFGHDTTLIPVASAVGVMDQIKEWPSVGSHFSFELWRNQLSNQHYVRMIYNDQPLLLPGASSHFCSFETFKQLCDRVKPHNFKQQCLMQLTPKTIKQMTTTE